MLLKLKNKNLLALDRLIKESIDKNGVPDFFTMEPQEAAEFLREIKIIPNVYKQHVDVKHTNRDNVDVRFMLNSELSKDNILLLVNKWFKGDFQVFYKKIEITIVRKKQLDVPEPQGPLHENTEELVLTSIEKKIPLLEAPKEPLSIPPPPPTPPPSRLIYGNLAGRCESCGSSVHYKWGFFGEDGCIQPKCEKYYKK